MKKDLEKYYRKASIIAWILCFIIAVIVTAFIMYIVRTLQLDISFRSIAEIFNSLELINWLLEVRFFESNIIEFFESNINMIVSVYMCLIITNTIKYILLAKGLLEAVYVYVADEWELSEGDIVLSSYWVSQVISTMINGYISKSWIGTTIQVPFLEPYLGMLPLTMVLVRIVIWRFTFLFCKITRGL